jgi:hypothetical protein
MLTTFTCYGMWTLVSEIPQVLEGLVYGYRGVVQYEIFTRDNGWAEDTLLTLFGEDFEPYTGPDVRGKCRFCLYVVTQLRCSWDYPWQRWLRRVEERIDHHCRRTKRRYAINPHGMRLSEIICLGRVSLVVREAIRKSGCSWQICIHSGLKWRIKVTCFASKLLIIK